MSMHKINITSPSRRPNDTIITIDGKEVMGVTSATAKFTVGEVNQIHLDVLPESAEIEVNDADVYIKLNGKKYHVLTEVDE